jgi:hypothetical protein
MSTDTLHPLAAEYLNRLRRAGRGLPRGRLKELIAEIEGHLSEAISPESSDAEALTVLDRLGEPEEIIEAEQPQAVAPRDRRGTHEWAAIVLLLFGGFFFGFGWLVGVILLWSSRAWTTSDKWIGTLIIPGGLATLLIALLPLGSSETCTGGPPGAPERCTGGPSTGHDILSIVIIAILVLAPIFTAVYLARRAE